MATPPSEEFEPQRVSLREEVSVSAAIAGITLSHQSIPLLGSSNPISQSASALAVVVLVGVMLVFVRERLQTGTIGMRLMRTGTVILSTYLTANAVNALVQHTYFELQLSGETATVFLLLLVAFWVTTRRGIAGMSKDRWAAEDSVNNDSELKVEMVRVLIKEIGVAGAVVLLLWVTHPASVWPAIYGFSAGILSGYVLAQLFYNPKKIGSKSRASVTLTTIGSMVVFVFIFA